MISPVVSAIVRRELKSWFGNPAGYVFICVFAFACAAVLLRDVFFTRNVASLDALSEWFPFLLVLLVPAITMGIWAGERGQGTDELLLTLPAKDSQIVLGKYLAAVAIYSIVLLFTLPLALIVGLLGDPDWLSVIATYLAWWLLGVVMIGAGMVASLLSDNLTVAFILGAVFCTVLVGAELIVGHFSESLTGSFASFLPVAQFHQMTQGLVPFSALVLMVGLAVAFYYANLTLVNRRHFRGGEGAHRWGRFACILVAAVALGMALGFRGPRIDATSGSLHSLSDDSSRLVAEIERPVVIEAFVPPINKTPKDYIQTRRDLLNVLREFSSAGGDKVLVRIVEAERYSDEARVAKEKFGIEPRGVIVEDEGGLREEHLLMGVACTSGPEQVVIPFLYNKLSVEYELTRSVRTVAQSERRRVGVLMTDVEIMGGFDQSTFRPKDPWMIVEELKLQYDVTSVYPTSEYPDDLDVLLAPMPSTLAQPEMDRLTSYIQSGKPVLILDDPDPLAAPGMAPTDPKGGPRNPMMMPQGDEPQKGNITGLLSSIGIQWNTSQLAWDVYNPHPELMEIPRTFVFVGANSGTVNSFHPSDVVSAGLQEMIFLSGGVVEPSEVANANFTPLLLTGPVSGTVSLSSFYTNSFFGKQPNPNARYATRPARTLACRVQREAKDGASGFNVIFVADLDFVSNTFFQLRRQKRPSSAAGSDFNFDNVTFLLNAVDSLAKDDSFIRLRKRRPEHRTLTRIEEEAKSFEDAFLRQRDAAEDEATKALDEARGRLDSAVEAVRKSTDLDEMTKEIRIQTIQEVENRRFELSQVKINDERDRLVEEARGERHRNTQRIKDFYKRMGWLLSPILGVAIGLFVFFRRVQRERESIPAERLKQGSGS